jgi:hypothetical protein
MILATGDYPRSKHMKGAPLELAPALLAMFLKKVAMAKCSSLSEAIFLVMCNPSMNEL